MKLMQVIFTLFVFSTGLLTSCSHGETSGEIGYKMISEFSKEAKKKYGLALSGLGGKYGEKIQRINIHFDGYYEVDVPSARRLFVKAARDFLEKVNHDERAIPRLIHQPFSIEDMDFEINFYNEDDTDVREDLIAYVVFLHGRILYCTHVPGRFIDAHEETYEEALAIIEAEERAELAALEL